MKDATDECKEKLFKKSDEGSSSSEEEVVITKDLTKFQKRALQELKKLLQDALDNNKITSIESDHNATMWGVPLLGDKRSDSIILKFLKATNFDVLDSYTMIKNTLLWRKEVAIDSLLGEDVGDDYDNVMFNHGYDKEGYPVWYLVLEDNHSLITASDEQSLRKFLRWLIQFAERNMRKLDFSTNCKNSYMLVIDLKSSTWFGNRDLYRVIYKFLQILQDYYPEFVTKQLWINVSWWYRYIFRAYSMVLDVWSTNETGTIAFSGQTKAIETLFKYISPAQVPVKYGGLSTDNEQDSDQPPITDDIVSDVTIKRASTHRLEYSVAKACYVLWKLRVISWDVIYDAKFVPEMEGSYITNISTPRKLTSSYKPVISEGFRVSEPGKLVLTIHNTSSKKKQLLARVHIGSSSSAYDQDEPSLRRWLVESDE
ncbi:Patellin-3 [Bienertia sinuspersici]